MISFSDNDQQLVVAAPNKISVYETQEGKEIVSICGTDLLAKNGVAFSQDQKMLVSWGDDTIQCWDAVSGEAIHEPMKHKFVKRGFVSVVFHPQQNYLLSFTDFAFNGDNALKLWNLDTGELIVEPMRHDHHVCGARFNHDGSQILAWAFDDTLRVWDANNGKQKCLTQSDDGVTGAVFNKDESQILSNSADGRVCLWRGDNGEPAIKAINHGASVYDAQLIANESVILICGGNELQAWDACNSQLLADIPQRGLSGFAVNDDETSILAYRGDYNGNGLFLFGIEQR